MFNNFFFRMMFSMLICFLMICLVLPGF